MSLVNVFGGEMAVTFLEILTQNTLVNAGWHNVLYLGDGLLVL